jgi:hypothetical protein
MNNVQIVAAINRVGARLSELERRKRPNIPSARGAIAAAAADAIHPAVSLALRSMLDPCDRTRPRIGLPTYPSQASQVCRQWNDISVVSGTAGIAVIGFNPCAANDGQYLVYSSNPTTFITAVMPLVTGGTAGTTSVTCSQLPYSTANLSANTVNARCIAMGIEFLSTTAELYEQGMVQTFVDPNHNSITGYGTSDMSARVECMTRPLKKGTVYHITCPPALATDADYTTEVHPYNNTGNCIGGVIVSGCSTTNPVTLLARVTMDIEYIGTGCEAQAQPKQIPPAGAYDHVVQLVHKAQSHHQQNPHLKPKDLLKMAHSAYKILNTPAGRAGVSLAKHVLLGL